MSTPARDLTDAELDALPDNSTHHLVQWNVAGGPMRCRYCKRTDVTSRQRCDKTPWTQTRTS